MVNVDLSEVRKLIAECKKKGGWKLDLEAPTVARGDDPEFLDKSLRLVLQRLPGLVFLGLSIENEATTLEVLARHTKDLPNLQALYLAVTGDTALKALAAQVTHLPSVCWLLLAAVGDDGLKGLASQMQHFRDLRELDCDSNEFGDKGLKALARQGKYLTNLHTLDLATTDVGDEGLKSLAEQASHLGSLQLLNLEETRVRDVGVKALADQAEHLGNLQHLGLMGTDVGDDGLKALVLAAQAGHLGKLLFLDVSETQVKCVAPELLKTGNVEQIFKAVIDGLTIPEAKIVVLGEPGVGKTSLCARLFRGRIPYKRKETHDFEFIVPKRRPRVRNLDIQLRVWDFGGQHVLHGTHEMFLTERSVCLLVLDVTQVKEHDPAQRNPERDGNRLSYWLKMIRHFVGEYAHVVLVVTKSDESDVRLGGLDADRLRIEHHFTAPIQMVGGFSATDKSRTQPVETLWQAIENALGRMDEVHSRVPQEFVVLKERVESQVTGRALVSLNEYRAWCRDVGVTSQREQDTYLRTLHNFGTAFYFGLLEFEKDRQDRSRGRDDRAPGQLRLLHAERDTALQRWLVNPRWFKHPLYRLIRRSNEKPWLTAHDISKAARRTTEKISLDDPDAAEDVVRGVLKLTELCFYDTERLKYFFPRGLPRDSVRFLTGWDESSRHEITWQWSFFPEAVIHRFIVQAHQYKEVLDNAQWRTGVVFSRGSAVVAIDSEPELGTVKVWLKKRSDNDSKPTRDDEKFIEHIYVRLYDLIGREPTSQFRSWGAGAGDASGSNSGGLVGSSPVEVRIAEVGPSGDGSFEVRIAEVGPSGDGAVEVSHSEVIALTVHPPEQPGTHQDSRVLDTDDQNAGKTRGQPLKRKTGRPKKNEKDSATKVIAALSKWHEYDNGSVINPEPATNRGLAKEYDGLAQNALTRFLKDRGGCKKYKSACHDGSIRALLALWRGELPNRHLRLRSHESGRDDD